MGTLSLSPLSLASSLLRHRQQFPLKTHLSNPIFYPKICSIKLDSSYFCNKSLVLRSSPNDSYESQFLDENGVVDDMDGYMNYLSLEYDSVWDTKPSWCQPWTIGLTGVLVIAGSWVVLHSVVITALVLSVIFAWWYIFLYSYPKAYTDMITERRKKVNSGAEDTFVANKIKNMAVIYAVGITEVPDFNKMYELYDPSTVMFFYRNKHIKVDLGTGNNNKINWALNNKKEFINIVETVYRGARKGRGLVNAPKNYSTKYRY